jgi:lysophospholipase L1-like esterase
MIALPIRLAAGIIVLAGLAAAQAGDLAAGVQAGVHDGAQVGVPDTVQALERKLSAQKHLLNDWAGLIRYGSENADIGPPKAGENRVVLLGDDTTDLWGRGSAKFFPGRPFLNRGIAGQTSAQMLVRFHQDVVALNPKAVVIQAGMNDLLVASEGVTAENFMSMVDIAKANGIRVVLASVTPVCDCFTKQTGLRPQGKIIGLNGWIKDYAARSGAVYLNYYSALADGRNFKRELTGDGLLPNDAGYSVMAPLVEKAIAEALKK